jgi:hypothetical protein
MIEIATILGGIVKTGLSLLEKHIDDPVRRLRARQEYIDSMKEVAARIIQEGTNEDIDKHLVDFVTAIHAL